MRVILLVLVASYLTVSFVVGEFGWLGYMYDGEGDDIVERGCFFFIFITVSSLAFDFERKILKGADKS